jgi:hypothetical protein
VQGDHRGPWFTGPQESNTGGDTREQHDHAGLKDCTAVCFDFLVRLRVEPERADDSFSKVPDDVALVGGMNRES